MKNPTIIASVVMASALFISTALICCYLHTLSVAVRDKPIPISPPAVFPGVIQVEVLGKIPTVIENANGKPISFVVQTNR